MGQLIDVSEPGMWETMSSYYQSTKHWETLKHSPLHRKAAQKERTRYTFLKKEVGAIF